MSSKFLNEVVMSLLHEMGIKMNYQLVGGIDVDNSAISLFCDTCSNSCSNDCYGGCEGSCDSGCLDSAR